MERIYFLRRELFDSIKTSLNWIIGSAGAFLLAVLSYLAAMTSPNGGRYLIALPFFAVFWALRSVFRIIRARRLLKKIGNTWLDEAHWGARDGRFYWAIYCWPLAVVLSIWFATNV